MLYSYHALCNIVKRSTISRVHWPHGGTTVAHRGGTGRVALIHDWLPRAVHGRGRPASAGRRNAAGLLRDPGAPVGGPRACAADEPARRGSLVQQEPRLARGGPAG